MLDNKNHHLITSPWEKPSMKRERIIIWLAMATLTFACSALPLGGSQNTNSSKGERSSTSGSDSVPVITVTPAVALPPEWTPTTSEGGTAEQAPMGSGWVRYQTADFSLSLPGDWQAVDVTKDGTKEILNLLGSLDDDWAKSIVEMVSLEEATEALKLWAMGPEQAGIGHPSANVTYTLLPGLYSANDVAYQSKDMYQEMGIKTLAVTSDLNINGFDTARLTIQISSSSFTIQQYQYIYIQNTQAWILSLAVDANEWPAFEPTFIEIANSFGR